jgi:hypothetical protein
MPDDMTLDDMTMVGCDGIRRSFDEHFDTMMMVEQDPSGAHHAIHNQHARIEELEAKLAKAVEALEKLARLGNGDRYGNSDGNTIARTTLAELKGEKDA